MLNISPVETPHRTKEEYVYETLRKAIMRCELKPGEKLVMDNLSEALGVSPIPIRGALQRLQAEGLAEIVPHTGAIVSEISLESITEIFALLEALENVAFEAVAATANQADIAELEGLIEQMETAVTANDPYTWYDLNDQFHLTIARLTGMKLLHRFTSRALDSRNRLRYFLFGSFVGPRMAQAHAEHKQMITLLKQKDSETLRTLVGQHNRAARDAYLVLIETQTNHQNS
jgi:DNA-binding GntR family transcriptional regulator